MWERERVEQKKKQPCKSARKACFNFTPWQKCNSCLFLSSCQKSERKGSRKRRFSSGEEKKGEWVRWKERTHYTIPVECTSYLSRVLSFSSSLLFSRQEVGISKWVHLLDECFFLHSFTHYQWLFQQRLEGNEKDWDKDILLESKLCRERERRWVPSRKLNTVNSNKGRH